MRVGISGCSLKSTSMYIERIDSTFNSSLFLGELLVLDDLSLLDKTSGTKFLSISSPVHRVGGNRMRCVYAAAWHVYTAGARACTIWKPDKSQNYE